MKSILIKERNEAAFKRLFKKAVAVSILIHIFVFLPIYVTSKTSDDKQYYTPPMYGEIVIPKKKATKRKKKPKPKKPKPKAKLKPKPKPKPKPKKSNALEYKKQIAEEKKKKEEQKKKALEDTLAKLREEVEKRDKLEETLSKLRDQVKEREPVEVEPEEPEPVKVEKRDERLAKGYGALTRNMMNITEKKYYNTIWKKIRDSWILPSGTSKDKGLITIIVIRIEKDGHVSKIDIEESSGSGYYDQSALRAIKKADPFPKFTEGMNRDFFKVGIRFKPTKDQ